MFSIDQVEPIAGDVKEKIMNERMRYGSVYEVIEKYLHNNGSIMIGGRIGVQLLLERERSTETFMFQYELFAENAFKHANILTNEVSKILSPGGAWREGEFIVWLKSQSTSSAYKKYSIYVDNRPIVTIIGIPSGATDIIKPVTVLSFDKKKNILVVPAEIMLLDIYRTLYTPGEVDLWDEYLSDENQLFHHLQERENIIRENAIDGGDEDHTGNITMKIRKHIEMVVMKEFIVNNAEIVLLGEHALHIINEDVMHTPIIHITTSMDIEQLTKRLDALFIKEGIKDTQGDQIFVNVKDQYFNIMKDHRLRRYVILVSTKEIMYVYNSAQYDIIPFNVVHQSNTKKFISIGNPFVILRFFLVEIWIVRWILSLGKIEESFAKKRIDSMLSQVLSLRKFMTEGSSSNKTITTISDSYFGETSEAEGLKIFQNNVNDYLGVFVSEVISHKRDLEEQKKYPDYMPQRYYKENNAYRVI